MHLQLFQCGVISYRPLEQLGTLPSNDASWG